MKILRLKPEGIDYAVAHLNNTKNKDNNGYVITHGSFSNKVLGPNWATKTYISKDIVNSAIIKQNNLIKLTNIDYVITPLFNKTDAKSNPIYIINRVLDGTSYTPNIYKEAIVFWDIPPGDKDTVKVELSGAVNVISKGQFGFLKLNKHMISPAYILHVSGDCKLKWFGLFDGVYKEQVVSYDFFKEVWNIDKVISEE